MFDLTFLTSNKVKVSHARHICRDYDVDIHQKRYYGVEYVEPRIFHDREKLLEQSFSDALMRWKKNGRAHKYFFFEDTSVRIEALSDEYDEPGIDIKYWMQDKSFEDVDKILKANGNNRKATVYSHIVLYIPEENREISSCSEYKIFTSFIEGQITDKEWNIDTQIVYPWLDNKTFNKWFIPNGYSVPVSLLDIIDADTVDFRKGALEDMMSYLKIEKKKDMTNKARQLAIPFFENFIVCGPTCSGKTTLGHYLVECFGYYHIEASQFMTMKYWETHGTRSSVDKHEYALKVLEVTPHYVVDKAIEYIQKKGNRHCFVITGFRSLTEIERFKKYSLLTNSQIIYLDAHTDVRYKRWKYRNRDNETYTPERFAQINKIQDSMGVKDIKQYSDAKIMVNDCENLDVFYDTIQRELLNGKLTEKNSTNISNMTPGEMSLEDSILYALGVEYSLGNNKYYTTTEITHLINKLLKNLSSPKNKNNVSRYFNQMYHPYYEIHSENSVNKFRLSPIGYSEFMLNFMNKSLEEN